MTTLDLQSTIAHLRGLSHEHSWAEDALRAIYHQAATVTGLQDALVQLEAERAELETRSADAIALAASFQAWIEAGTDNHPDEREAFFAAAHAFLDGNYQNPVPHTRGEIVTRLRAVADEMVAISIGMDYYGGFGPMSQHAKEMMGAAHIARGWADGIEKEQQ